MKIKEKPTRDYQAYQIRLLFWLCVIKRQEAIFGTTGVFTLQSTFTSFNALLPIVYHFVLMLLNVLSTSFAILSLYVCAPIV